MCILENEQICVTVNDKLTDPILMNRLLFVKKKNFYCIT